MDGLEIYASFSSVIPVGNGEYQFFIPDSRVFVRFAGMTPEERALTLQRLFFFAAENFLQKIVHPRSRIRPDLSPGRQQRESHVRGFLC